MAYLVQNGSLFKALSENCIYEEETKSMAKKTRERMSIILQSLKGKSLNNAALSPGTTRPLSPAILAGSVLSSDLTVHPPVDGKFTAELILKKQLVNEKSVVLKVSDGKLEIFFTKQDQDDGDENLIQEENKTNRKWISKINIFRASGRKGKKRSDIHKMTVKRQSLDEKDLVPHGCILLPDYILTETLTFSLNPSGDLNIQADMKGVITPSYIFRKKILKVDNQSPSLMKWVRELALRNSSDSENSEMRPRAMSNVEGMRKSVISDEEEIPRPRFFSMSNPSYARVNWQKK